VVENQYLINNIGQDTWSVYLYELKSPMTRQKHHKRLEKFFDFIGIQAIFFLLFSSKSHKILLQLTTEI
jgi:hypothetical protein